MKLPEELQFIANARMVQRTTHARMEGRLCIITGATSGVGYHAARRLAQGGDRNRFLFQWYTISDPSLILIHLAYLPFVLTYSRLKEKMSYPIGFIQALLEWRRVKQQVRQKVPNVDGTLRDREILEIVQDRAV